MNILKLILNYSEYDKKTITQAALKLAEETGEVAEAILSFNGAPACAYKDKKIEDIIEECIDVIIVATSIIKKSKPEIEAEDLIKDLEDIIFRKLQKWKKKCEE